MLGIVRTSRSLSSLNAGVGLVLANLGLPTLRPLRLEPSLDLGFGKEDVSGR